MKALQEQVRKLTICDSGKSKSSSCHHQWVTMGCLGWDSEPSLIKARATEVIAECGFDYTTFSGMGCRRDGGSTVQFLLNDDKSVEDLKNLVRNLNKTYLDSGKTVWADIKKTAEELRPSRLVKSRLGIVSAEHGGKASQS